MLFIHLGLRLFHIDCLTGFDFPLCFVTKSNHYRYMGILICDGSHEEDLSVRSKLLLYLLCK